MKPCGLDDAPAETTAQLARLAAALSADLGISLIGVYLHGSLALNCFNPAQSDLDVLAVVDRPLTGEDRRALARSLLGLSAAPHPIEISVLAAEALRAWHHPAPFEFHYSESWRAPLQAALDAAVFMPWSDPAQTDRDLAAHLTVARRRGRCLAGRPLAEVLPEIPAADYAEALLADLAWTRPQLAELPVYAALNVCRVLAFAREGLVLSKAEGGAWARSALPAEFQALIEAALTAYAGQPGAATLNPSCLARFFAYGEDHSRRLRTHHHVHTQPSPLS